MTSYKRTNNDVNKSEFINQLCSFTGVSESFAHELLQKSHWNVARAADVYFMEGFESNRFFSPAPPIPIQATDKQLDAWFDQYADPEDVDYIYDEGIHRLCEEIELDPHHISLLILSWLMHAKTMCKFTRLEWKEGMKKLRCKSSGELREQVHEMNRWIEDPSSFKEFYSFCFDFSREEGQKSLDLETALALWKIVLQPRYPVTSIWCQFIRSTQNHGFSKDTWNLLFDFFNQGQDKLEKYDENGAWPILIDDFMDWKRKKTTLGK